jgi:DNA (cytosine-5)-methyltransferase 1
MFMTIADAFCGIGGFSLAFNGLGAKTIWACEIDKDARATYKNNFPDIHGFDHDIQAVNPCDIPDFDILTAGFPCQPFSIIGERKGLQDKRGTLFYSLVDILKVKRPAAYLFENVAGLLNHDGGATLDTIKKSIENIGYSCFYKVIRACDVGIPYRLPTFRPRLYIVGYKNRDNVFKFPETDTPLLSLSDILGGVCERKIGYTLRVSGRGSGYNSRFNWDSYNVDGKIIRLTVDQAKKLMGYPDDFILPSESKAFKQLGNSVAVNTVAAIGESIIGYLNT